MNLEKMLKLAQQLTFTTFLILCVAVMGYAVTRLYADSRSDWDKVSSITKSLEEIDKDMNTLMQRMDALLGRKLEAPPKQGPF